MSPPQRGHTDGSPAKYCSSYAVASPSLMTKPQSPQTWCDAIWSWRISVRPGWVGCGRLDSGVDLVLPSSTFFLLGVVLGAVHGRAWTAPLVLLLRDLLGVLGQILGQLLAVEHEPAGRLKVRNEVGRIGLALPRGQGLKPVATLARPIQRLRVPLRACVHRHLVAAVPPLLLLPALRGLLGVEDHVVLAITGAAFINAILRHCSSPRCVVCC